MRDRRWEPFRDIEGKAGAAGSDAGAGASGGSGGADADDGFVIESGSVAFTAAPEDSTAREQPPIAEAKADEATAEGVSASAAEPVVDGEEEHAGAEAVAEAKAAAAKPATGAKPAKKGGKASLDTRIADKQHEVDRLTHLQHRTKSEIARDEARLKDLQDEIAALEAKKGAPAGAAAPKAGDAGAAAVKDDPEPEHPKYRDFSTDEEYEAAAAKWRTEHRAWNDRRIDAIKADLTQGIEARFETADQSAAMRAAQQTLATTLRETADSFPDWDEKAEALKEIQSSWYDPKAHGQATTPFLSDLSQSLLMRGSKEGATLLHWLGSDPERAQRLADLRPTRPLRDALVRAPSVTPLLEHFASDEGAKDWEGLKRMHPIEMMQAIGALSVRLAPVSRGSGAAVHPITEARPSARPQVGSPAARAATEKGTGSGVAPASYLDWHLDEDVKEILANAKQAGLALTADEAREVARKRLAG